MARKTRIRDFLEDVLDDGDGENERLGAELAGLLNDRQAGVGPQGPVDDETVPPAPSAPAPAAPVDPLGEVQQEAADALVPSDVPPAPPAEPVTATPTPAAATPKPTRRRPEPEEEEGAPATTGSEGESAIDLSFDGIRRGVEDRLFPGLADAPAGDETADGLQNLDGDRLPDSLDLDVDGDRVINQLDVDDDNDGVPDLLDPDDDGDGLRDRTETSLVAPILDARGDLTSDVNASTDDDLDPAFAVDVASRTQTASQSGIDPGGPDPSILRRLDLSVLESDLDRDGAVDERDDDIDGDGFLNRFDPDDDNDGTFDIDDLDEEGDGFLDGGENEVRAAHETVPEGPAPTVDVVIPEERIAPAVAVVVPEKAVVNPASEVRDAGVGDGNAAAKSDLDRDGIHDRVDDDIDGDFVVNEDDDDDDNDGVLDVDESDIDGDGFTDSTEKDAFLVDAQTVAARDAVGVPKAAVERDPVHARAADGARAGNSDLDGDTKLDRDDDDIDGDGILNQFDDDDDEDFLIDGLDRDDDGDGFIDESEPSAFAEFNERFGAGAAALEVDDAERQGEAQESFDAFVEEASEIGAAVVDSVSETFGFLGFNSEESDPINDEVPVFEE